MVLDLSTDEMAILEELLDKQLKSLPIEIHHTRTNEFKNYLRQKQKLAEDLLGRLKRAEGG